MRLCQALSNCKRISFTRNITQKGEQRDLYFAEICLMKKTILLSLFISSLFSNAATSQDLTSDSLAIVAIYNACDGPNWNSNNVVGWFTSDISQWNGIWVTNGRITSFQCSNCGMKNEMPDDIYNLTALRQLTLSESNLTFNIDDRIGDLEDLEILDLRNLDYPGDLEIFCEVENLKELTIGSTATKGPIPSCLAEKPFTRLAIRDADFEAAPIPEIFSEMEDLKFLFLTNNNLTGPFPESVCDVDALRVIDFAGNAIGGELPACLDLSLYWQFFVKNCGMTGKFPMDKMGEGIGILEAEGNSFDNDISSIPAIPNTYVFDFADSKLSGTFDAEIFDKEWILRVDMKNNNIEEMVNWNGFADRLNFLDMSGNRLDFDDLESVEVSESVNFQYHQQQPLTSDETKMLVIGESYTLTCPESGANTTYQWYKDGEAIAGASAPVLALSNLQFSDVGNYHCEALNEAFPDLTLTTGITNLDVVSGLEYISNEFVQIYPNPASDYLHIKSEKKIEAIEVYNTLGQKVLGHNASNVVSLDLDVQHLPTGIYSIILHTEQYRVVDKFEKQ